jgi:hypothetical protein
MAAKGEATGWCGTTPKWASGMMRGRGPTLGVAFDPLLRLECLECFAETLVVHAKPGSQVAAG